MTTHCVVCKQKIKYFDDMPKAAQICKSCRSITVPCRCGCGGDAYLYGYDGKQRKGYLLHHYSRTSKHKAAFARCRPEKPNEGNKHSLETRIKMSRNRRGSGNANWKGGLTMQVRGIRRSPQYYQWRKDVLSRDKHACRLCGAMNNLHAHHKLPVVEYPDEIFSVLNGLTLCRECHERTHLINKES